MDPAHRQKAVFTALKKIRKGKGGSDDIAALLDLHLPTDHSPEAVLEELSLWLVDIRHSLRQRSLSPHASIPDLIHAFQKVAHKRNIDTDHFYSSLVERFLLEEGTDEDARIPSKQSTKEKILDAALQVFSEKGFHSATVDEIAERAGVGKGTLYRYFATKETLFNELLQLRLEELERTANAVLDGQDDVLTMIAKYLRIYFEFFDRNQQLYRLILQERPDVGKEVQDLYVKKVMRRTPLLKRKIYKGTQQGVLKDVDFQTVFYGVMGFIHGVIQKWLACDCSYSLVDELPTVTEVLFYGFVKSSEIANKP